MDHMYSDEARSQDSSDGIDRTIKCQSVGLLTVHTHTHARVGPLGELYSEKKKVRCNGCSTCVV